MSVLDQQLDAYERSTLDFVGADVRLSVDADIDELIDIGIALFEAAKTAVARRRDQIKASLRPFRMEEARQFDALYQRLHSAFDRIGAAVNERQGAGLWVQGADRFQLARRELRLIASLPVDRVMQAEWDIDQGKGRALGQVMDELRDRHRP